MDSIKMVTEYFAKGGIVMWPLLLCSIMVVTIAIERFVFYKETDSGSDFADEYCALMSENKFAEAMSLAEKTKGECARILFAAMKMAANLFSFRAGCPSAFAHAFRRLGRHRAAAHLFLDAPPHIGVHALPVRECALQHRAAHAAQQAAGDLVDQRRGELVDAQNLGADRLAEPRLQDLDDGEEAPHLV